MYVFNPCFIHQGIDFYAAFVSGIYVYARLFKKLRFFESTLIKGNLQYRYIESISLHYDSYIVIQLPFIVPCYSFMDAFTQRRRWAVIE